MPAVPHIMREVGTSADSATWTLTAYLLAAAVLTPVMGRLGDMFGRRRMLLVVLVIATIGYVVSALGDSIAVIVIGRVMQGILGSTYPLCFGIIRTVFPAARVSASVGLISATIGVGGGLGLLAGGALIDQGSYRWILWLAAALTAATAVCAYRFVPESPRLPGGRVDIPGALVLTVGLLMPLVAISQANVWGWGHVRTLTLIAAGIAVLIAWGAMERRIAQPLVDISSLAHPTVLMTNTASLLTGVAMIGAFTLAPELAQTDASIAGYGLGLTATGASLLLLPGMVGMLVVGPVAGIMGARIGNKYPLALGGALAAIGLFTLGLEHDSRLTVAACGTLLFCGLGLAYAAMPNLIMDAVAPHQTSEATGFNTMIRAVGFSLGAQACAAVLSTGATHGSLPTEHGFTVAFTLSAGGAAVAAAAALLIPRRTLRSSCRAPGPSSGPAARPPRGA
jgi:MFS family permease